MKNFLCVSLLTLMLLAIPTILIVQPWRDISVVSIHSTSSANDISTYISITANDFFIYNTDDFSEHLFELYKTNSLPNIMLSDEHYTQNSSVTFLIHSNQISRFLGLDYLRIEL